VSLWGPCESGTAERRCRLSAISTYGTDGRAPMRKRSGGVWENLYARHGARGECYKYEIVGIKWRAPAAES